MSRAETLKRIRGRMAELGVTQELTESLGLERSALSRLLRGSRPLSEEMEGRIWAKLDVLEEEQMSRAETLKRIRGRMAELGVTQERLTESLGLERSALSRLLRGSRPLSEEMEGRIWAKLDLLREADRAAEEARGRVMAGNG